MSKEKQIEERIELSDIIDYALRDWDDYIYECQEEGNLPIDTFEEWIADAVLKNGYRKQSENVIELPCKVGTTLYFLYNSPYADKPDLTPRIYKTADWYFEVDKTGIVICTSDIHSLNKEYDYYLGKTVFLTSEEAKKALAKMKGGAE